MGKAGRWLRSLLGGKKALVPTVEQDAKPRKEKKKWGFVRSFRDKEKASPAAVDAQVVAPVERRGSYREGGCYSDGVEQNKHAIAVAAATAAVAEAAVAAAQAAAAVVKLTSSGRCGAARKEDLAALRIQTAFRGYLARRAMRALKGLVKLQALVRGYIVRKQAAETFRCMQALVRAQSRARAGRALISENRHLSKSYHSNTGPATPEKYESMNRVSSTKNNRTVPCKRNTSKLYSFDAELDKSYIGSCNRLDRRLDDLAFDDEKNDKILEIDTGKQNLNSKRKTHPIQQSHSAPVSDRNSHSFATLPDSPLKDSTTAQMSIPSPSSVEMQSLSPLQFACESEDSVFDTAENSPQFYSASSRAGSLRRGPFTASKSDGSRSIFSGYSDYPSYMANTESSRAKVRSQSAPKQRPEFEKSGSTKRLSVNGIGDGRASGSSSGLEQRSSLHVKFTNKAYPGSGRLDRLGMPVNGGVITRSRNYC